MSKGKSVIISICLIFLFLCQLMPVVPKASAYFDSSPASGYVWFDINPLHDSVPFLHSTAEKPLFAKILAKAPDGNIELNETSQTIGIEKQARELWPDMRDSIREAVPQYFNGSKYKINLFS